MAHTETLPSPAEATNDEVPDFLMQQLERRKTRDEKKTRWVVRQQDETGFDLAQRSLVKVMSEETPIEKLRDLAGDPWERKNGLTESQRIESVRTCRTVVGPLKDEVQEDIWQRRKQREFNHALLDYLERFEHHWHEQENVVRVPRH